MQFRVSHLQGLPSESVTAGAMITDQVTGLRITSRLARSRLDHGESDRENNGDSPPGACADHNRDCETARPAPTPLTAQAAEKGTGGARPPPGSWVRVPVPGSPSRAAGPSSLAPPLSDHQVQDLGPSHGRWSWYCAKHWQLSLPGTNLTVAVTPPSAFLPRPQPTPPLVRPDGSQRVRPRQDGTVTSESDPGPGQRRLGWVGQGWDGRVTRQGSRFGLVLPCCTKSWARLDWCRPGCMDPIAKKGTASGRRKLRE